MPAVPQWLRKELPLTVSTWDHQGQHVSGQRFENQDIKKQWEFYKLALSNGVEKKKERDQAGREELWVQHRPSHTESWAARFQPYQGYATWLPCFICMGKISTGKKQQGVLRTLLSVLCCEIVHICVRDSSAKFSFDWAGQLHSPETLQYSWAF